MGVPCVNIGNRQNGREKAHNVKNVEHNSNHIIKALKYQTKSKKYKKSKIYGNGNSGDKILKIILNLKIKNTQKKLSYAK